MTEQKRSGIRIIPYRVWLILALAAWLCVIVGVHNTRAVRRERIRMDVAWASCDVVLYQFDGGRDACRYMHLEQIEDFVIRGDGWQHFTGGFASSDPTAVSAAMSHPALPLMEQLTAVQTGAVFFRDESPRTVSSYTDFTLAVYDAEAKTLYYVEYRS